MTTLKNIATGLIASAIMVLGALYATPAEACACGPIYPSDPVAVPTTLEGCFLFDVEQPNVSQELIDRLMTAGWAGDPTDSREALYNPGCWE